MLRLLLGIASLAAVALPAAPASAMDRQTAFGGSGDGSHVRVHRGSSVFRSGPEFGSGLTCDMRRGGFRRGHGDDHDGDRHHGRRDGGRGLCGDFVLGGWGYDEAWALYNNRSWESDSYNDWWHDQPWRSYPRWMQKNQDCSRAWYAGDTLRC